MRKHSPPSKLAMNALALSSGFMADAAFPSRINLPTSGSPSPHAKVLVDKATSPRENRPQGS
jgi:hypothetical protein